MKWSTTSNGLTRGAFLRRAAAGAGAAAGGAAIFAAAPSPSASKPSAAGDKEILAAALVLEDLQAAFYADAIKRAELTGEKRRFAQVVGRHEREHAAFIRKALGRAAKRPNRFTFGSTTTDQAAFLDTAQKLEDVGVAVLNGQGPNLTPETLAAVGKILSVEARHAGWARDLAGAVPAPAAVDVGVSVKEALTRVHALGIDIA